MISEIIEPHIDDIYRIQTNGFFCHNKVNLETSNKMGQLKLEYENKNINIEHVNKIICLKCNDTIKKCIKHNNC